MDALPLSLILISTLLHASWNLIGKKHGQSLHFYAELMLAGMLLYSPVLIWHWQAIWQLPAPFWGWLAASGLFQVMYLAGLAYAYRGGNLSLVYPLARALPVLLVPLLVWLLWAPPQLSGGDGVGMLLIFLGALALPLQRWRQWHWRDYATPAVAWIGLAALGTAGYSLTDSAAIKLMVAQGMSPLAAGSCFVVLQAASCLLWMAPWLKRVTPAAASPPAYGMAALGGLFIIGTYLLVLVSMGMVEEVSYVVALRQVSIPIGVLIGVCWLGERLSLPRMQGLLLMLMGLLLVAL
ncbi:hypothetical protein [Balneatrix alpica]|uniref:Uncharacterized protein n=1 Tax=Balneatrix alpica TaxID=75684 RepID=A0ABV5Z9G3_9GAMM|nr:hypothetical protein [Balneatrix alpica]